MFLYVFTKMRHYKEWASMSEYYLNRIWYWQGKKV